MSPTDTRRRVLFVYGNDPSPTLLERMQVLERSGDFDTHAIFWHRVESNLQIPWSSELPPDRFTSVALPDPRGNLVRRAMLSLRFARSVRSAIRRYAPHIVDAIYPDMLITTKMAICGLRKRPTVYDLWDLHGKRGPGWAARAFWRRLFRRVDLVFVSSDGYRQEFLEKFRLTSSNTSVRYVPNCPLDWKYVRTADTEAQELTVGYVGQLRVRPQMMNLIRAIQAVRSEGLDVRLFVSGAGNDRDWIVEQAAENDFIDFAGPFNYVTDLEPIYARCDVMFAVYPQDELNYRTHWARRSHQSIVSGIPLIVAAGSLMGRYLTEHAAGWEVDDLSESDLEQLLTRLAGNPNLVTAASANCLELAEAHRLETYAEQIVDAYRSLEPA